MPRFINHIIGIMLVILIAGCAGGGCSSGCAGCGMTPIPGGFEPTARIENAGSVRLTNSGLTFLEQNLGPLAKAALGSSGGNGGVITFPVPSTGGSQLGIKYDVCPGGPDANANPPKCIAEIDIGNAKLNIDSADPHNIHITGPLPIRMQDLPIDVTLLIIPSTTHLHMSANGCNTPAAYADVNLDVDISVEVDTDMTHSRAGYSRVKVNKVDIDKNQLGNAISFCGGGLASGILGTLKGILLPLLIDPLIGSLSGQIESALCQQATVGATPECPQGSTNVMGVCRYGTDANAECVSTLLGLEGHTDLSGALASVSPGTKGAIDILFAVGGPGKRPDNSGFAWGDLNPIAQGATLGMFGGAEASPLSSCVKFSDMALPTGIAIPAELVTNDPPTLSDPNAPQWPAALPGPHVGIALAERYANYALNGIYNSGTLCLGISTETIPQLSSGTLALLANSLKDLGLQREAQQVALVVRPGKPPTATFGNGTDINKDPTLRIKLNQASFDFYIWSTDRFIRFMTATFDLDVPINLAVTKDGLLPVLDKIGVTNGVVTNSELLREDPVVIASALQGLLGSLAGQFLGGIAPINLSSALGSLGLTLTIPETIDGQGSPGLRKLNNGNDNYLGIFATLGIAGAPFKANTTTLSVVKKNVDPAAFRIASATEDNAPAVHIQLSSPADNGAQAVEYSYRVDQGAWKPFRRERMVTVRDEWLRLQGKHTISARSRVVGHPESLDETPATIDVVIDAEAPVIAIAEPEGALSAIDVRDVVSGGTEPHVRYRLDGNTWSDWKLASEIKSVAVGNAEELTVEAKDDEGNIATASQALIRGRGIPSMGGCGCAVVGDESSSNNAAWLLALGMVGAALRLARRRSDKPTKANPSNPEVRA
jgi:MYXO-CTERM domain-containing protein